MSKIYRLHSGASEAVLDWTQVDGYLDTAAINQIPDSAGANARTQITSIPSPFARIDLVKTAFKQVVAEGKPEGISIFHKIVSDTLDVGQVFFHSTNPDSKVELIAWNPGLSWRSGNLTEDGESDLGQLLRSDAHRLYGETLKMFFAQDAAEYNFDKLQQFYLLNYRNGPGRLNIIGGTSPATLFFSSANNLSYVDLRYKNDKLFDEDFCPLPERSEDYILFLYALREAMPGFRTDFKAVDDYLELCLQFLDPATRQKVLALNRDSYRQSYGSIALAGEGNHPEILGFELRGIKTDHGKPEKESDFVIAPTQAIEGFPPLVLPAYTFNGNMNYVDGRWPAQLKAPFYDARPMSERMLPGQEIRYPYLTISDFLEPYLVQLPFEPDGERFFNGHLSSGNQEGYLLPLTSLFFRYFRSSDLLQPMADGNRMLELERLPGFSIKVKLRVPVKNGRYIDMERIYETDKARVGHTSASPELNRGIIRAQQFSMAIYPFVRRDTDDHAVYTVMLLDHDEAQGTQPQYQLKYYKDTAPGKEIPVKAQRQKSNKREHFIDTVYDVVLSEFDYIMVDNGKVRGCLLPLFPFRPGVYKEYAFAVDFGTTNTHIEYSVDGGLPRPLDITAEDRQLVTLHVANDATYNHLTAARFGKGATLLLEQVPKEMMPPFVGPDERYKFPRRTVISEATSIDLVRQTYPLADFSLYWHYENGMRDRQLRAHTNLKWGSLMDDKMIKRIEGYIANLVLLMRNKVVLNGGDLARTKITWFYPTSMSDGRLNQFENIWNEQVERYMGAGIEAIHLPESVAPFYFFRKENAVVSGDKPVINIDIGGGTTDVVVYRGESIISYTSFRFAGNALFGDGYNNRPAGNGFVQFFERRYRPMLKDTILAQYLPEERDIERSDEFVTMLFGLQQHPDRGEVSFSFTQKLFETDELKLVPLLFISSIFYHVARYQKAQHGELPRYITFSGTASKMLRILDLSKNLRSITRLANQVFNDVFGSEAADIKLVAAEGPKEVTAKGGLYQPAAPAMSRSVWFGMEDSLGPKALTYRNVSEEAVREAVVKELNQFIDLFFNWSGKLDFASEFALNTRRFAEFKKLLKTDLDIFLVEGIEELKQESNLHEDGPIRETLFFMPLKGVLNQLAFSIIENN